MKVLNIAAFVALVFVASVFVFDFFTGNVKSNKQYDAPPVMVSPVVPTAPVEKEIKNPTSYDEAVSQSKQQNKKLVLFFGADWCGWCHKLDETLKDSKVQAKLVNYVVWHVDVDKDKKTTSKHKVTGGIPAYVMLNVDGSEAARGSGYKKPAEFIQWLN